MRRFQSFFAVSALMALWGFFVFSASQKQADMVIFSYDRPLQLYALLESLDLYVTGIGSIQVVCRVSNDRYADAYNQLQSDFSRVVFIKQGKEPRKDFKPLTVAASFESPCEYIIYAVDDIVVKDFIDIGRCIDLLEKTNAWGFYLRLGVHLSWCYTRNCAQKVPPCVNVRDDVISWRFSKGSFDWGYPHTVDMTIYRKSDIKGAVSSLTYTAPNSFEASWSQKKPARPNGLCYELSKIVNLPLNRVQNDVRNRTMNLLTSAELLERFEKGERINIFALFNIINKSAHMEYVPTFIGC